METGQLVARALDKLDQLDGRLDIISSIMIRQEALLAEHIRRTEILEMELAPIKTHVANTAAVAKIIAGLGALLSVFLALKQLIS